jgi:hypothetical protein
MIIELGASQRVTDRIADIELCDTYGAMFEMMFEFGNTVGAQLAVEIAVEGGTAKITTHAYSSLRLKFKSPRGASMSKASLEQ